MRKIEIVQIHSEEMNKTVNAISVDGLVFDWCMEPDQFNHAKSLIEHHKGMKESIILSITNHFLESFCEFIGQKITLNELNKAIMNGQIE